MITDPVRLVPRPAVELRLPAVYSAVSTFDCTDPVSADVEVMRVLSELETARGSRPTVVFSRVTDGAGPVLGNPYPRAVLHASLRVAPESRLADIRGRLGRGTVPTTSDAVTPAVRRSVDLDQFPAVRHRPGDAGRYLTAAVLVTSAPADGRVNLGIYRAQVAGPDRLLVFLNPRSDGHANLTAWHAAGRDMPVALFLGADPVYVLVAAAGTLVPGVDDYAVAARLLGRPVELESDPPVPVEAPHVIRGRLTPELRTEGPFGEFKGFYTEPGQAHVLRVDDVHTTGAPVPFVLPAAESGLALSGLEAEIRLAMRLAEAGFLVRDIRYPPDGFGKYLALIEADNPTENLLEAALRLDPTAKVAVCGEDLAEPWKQVGLWPADLIVEPYWRRGRPSGRRLGILARPQPGGRPVEY